MFTVGERINHSTYGEGTIVDIIERVGFANTKDSPIVIVKFDNQTRTKYREVQDGYKTLSVREETDEFEFTDWSLEQHLVKEGEEDVI